MRLASLFFLASTASALSIAPLGSTQDSVYDKIVGLKRAILGPRAACPAVWTKVAAELKPLFKGSDGLCTDNARAAIRAAFHDCGSWQPGVPNTGCTGSLFLAPVERTLLPNKGLATIIPILGALAQKYNVGVADMFQFAGASAVHLCPLGPKVQTFVGRTDSSVPHNTNLLPSPFDNSTTILSRFAVMGFSPVELAALIGAHTASRQFNVDTSAAKVGLAQDSTPGVWDILYYGQTLLKTAPFSFQSDLSLAQDPKTKPSFLKFSVDPIGWSAAFAPAMTKMGSLGVPNDGLIDCTSALP